MKVTLKTIQADKIEVELKPSMTIAAVKQQISTLYGFPPALQKLIGKAKILEDSYTLEDYSFDEGDTIILINRRPNAPVPSPVHKPHLRPRTATKPRVIKDVPVVHNPQTTSSGRQQEAGHTSRSQHVGPSSSFGPGRGDEAHIAKLVEIGFAREDALRAMKAASGIFEQALESLMNAFSEPLHPPAAPQRHDHPTSRLSSFSQPTMRGGSFEAKPSIEELLGSYPNFRNILSLVETDPMAIPQFIRNLRFTDPELLVLITENSGAFIEFINGLLPDNFKLEVTNQAKTPTELRGPQMYQRGTTAPLGSRPQAQVFEFTFKELEEIRSLAQLGFSDSDAIEAYMASGKNLAVAGNLLFERYVPIEEALASSGAYGGSYQGSSLGVYEEEVKQEEYL
jgi:UV excision repair protein RAD23